MTAKIASFHSSHYKSMKTVAIATTALTRLAQEIQSFVTPTIDAFKIRKTLEKKRNITIHYEPVHIGDGNLT